LLAARPTPKMENHTLLAYSIYSQLPSVCGRRFSRPQAENSFCDEVQQVL